jgi:hypothetical protein
MNLKEAVAVFALIRTSLEAKQEELSNRKELFNKSNEHLMQEIEELKTKLNDVYGEIETDIKQKFNEDKSVKKFYGGFGIQEKKKIEYDFQTALKWAKEKDMFITLDTKSFEKAVEGLNLDFVKLDKEPQVTTPKEIKLD